MFGINDYDASLWLFSLLFYRLELDVMSYWFCYWLERLYKLRKGKYGSTNLLYVAFRPRVLNSNDAILFCILLCQCTVTYLF